MKQPILTEKRNPKTINIDLMDSFHIAQTINKEDKKVPKAVERELKKIAKAIDKISNAFLKGGRLAYFGAGTSGRLGVLDASEMLPTFGAADLVYGFIAGGEKALRHPVENAEDSKEFALKDIKTFNPAKKDIIVGISASGNPQYVLTVLEEARKKGALTIGVCSNPKAKMKALSDIFICPILGEEVITGSSRMKSGTAQKLILNMLTTGSFIKIGKTFQNLMIDLRLSNAKLLDRGCRIVSEITGIDCDSARCYLQKSNKNVKTACVMAIKNCSKQDAEKLLKNVRGILRKLHK